MSIASEIERLQTAKADLKTAIEAKGVEISGTDTIDTYASKVEAIQSGGGDDFYDVFWDNYQDYGNRTVYGKNTGCYLGFDTEYWNDSIFNPKYDIKPTTAYRMFRYSNITNLRDLDIVLDFSNCTDMRDCFEQSKIKYLGVIDCSKLSGTTAQYQGALFGDCTQLQSIEKLILKGGSPLSSTMFQNCTALTEVIVEGVIDTSINAVFAPLIATSAKSFINCLANYAGTENEFVYTITFSETTWGYLDAEGETASPSGNSWREYINDLGWNAS